MTSEKPSPSPEDRMPFRDTRPFETEPGAFATLHEFSDNPRYIVKEISERDYGTHKDSIPNIKDDIEDAYAYLSPYIPKTHIVLGERGPGEKKVYLATERIEGRTLEDLILSDDPVPEEIAEQLDDFLSKHTGLFLSTYNEQRVYGRSLDLSHFERNIMIGRNLNRGDKGDRLYFVDMFPTFSANPFTLEEENRAIQKYVKNMKSISLPKTTEANKKLDQLLGG